MRLPSTSTSGSGVRSTLDQIDRFISNGLNSYLGRDSI
jgi:hypothetical protein